MYKGKCNKDLPVKGVQIIYFKWIWIEAVADLNRYAFYLCACERERERKGVNFPYMSKNSFILLYIYYNRIFSKSEALIFSKFVTAIQVHCWDGFVHRALYQKSFIESWREKGHKQQGRTGMDCQAKPIQGLVSASQGEDRGQSQCIKSHHTQMCQGNGQLHVSH